jgi:hypothetical protein
VLMSAYPGSVALATLAQCQLGQPLGGLLVNTAG